MAGQHAVGVDALLHRSEPHQQAVTGQELRNVAPVAQWEDSAIGHLVNGGQPLDAASLDQPARLAWTRRFRWPDGPRDCEALAVDSKSPRPATALGAPVWLDMDRREASGLWVAQDTGGAIKGANRFDTFWGAGQDARARGGLARQDAGLRLPRARGRLRRDAADRHP